MPGHHNLAKLTVKFAVTHTDILHANFELPNLFPFCFPSYGYSSDFSSLLSKCFLPLRKPQIWGMKSLIS